MYGIWKSVLAVSVVAVVAVVAFAMAPHSASSKKNWSGPGDPEGGQNACVAIAGVEENLECRNLLIDIASLYLDSIATLPPGEILPELPDFVHLDARRWINRNPIYQPPNNDGIDEFLQGVRNEPSCDFPDRRWVVEGNIEYGIASGTFTAICDGFPREVPTLVRDRFLIEDGKIKEVEVIFLLVD